MAALHKTPGELPARRPLPFQWQNEQTARSMHARGKSFDYKLWDHFLELGNLVQPHIALDNPYLDGLVPETSVTRNPADAVQVGQLLCLS